VFLAQGFPRVEPLRDGVIAPPGTFVVAIAFDVESFRD